jgi:hypothetical protein
MAGCRSPRRAVVASSSILQNLVKQRYREKLRKRYGQKHAGTFFARQVWRDDMSARPAKATEREQDRQELLKELAADYGSEGPKQYEPGSFGCHELLDRTNLIGDMVEEYILNHPACVPNKEWFALAHDAVTALRELYQKVGAEHMGVDDGAVVRIRYHR